MNIEGSINAVLNQKGRQVWSVPPTATVYDAIQMMAEKNVGALPVLESGQVLGMISERDYTRKVILQGKSSKQTPVKEIMSSNVYTVSPTTTVLEAMRIMTEHHIRHLPVIDDNRMVGLVSIGNLVNWVISAQHAAIGHLEDFIRGAYPG